jgi:hypothetical protein
MERRADRAGDLNAVGCRKLMALIKPAVKLIVREGRRLNLLGPALSLGVPEVYATYDELRRWLETFHGETCRIRPDEVGQSQNRFGRRLGWVDARTFLKVMGIDTFHSLDLPGSEYGADIYHDLNEPLPAQWHGNYQLLVDPGTLEHVFDVRTCLANIVRALAVGGIVVHLVPIYSYNGGYYSINPNVLNDFYRVNGFCDLTSYVIMWDRYRPFTTRRTRCYLYREDVLGSRHALTEADQVRYTPHLLMFARKSNDSANIVVPLQFDGHYLAEASALGATRSQSLEKTGRRWAARVQRFLPLEAALYIQTAAYRRLVRWRARRTAGFWI